METMQFVYDHLATCGHRIGQLRFVPGGVRCDICSEMFPWGRPLVPTPIPPIPTATPAQEPTT